MYTVSTDVYGFPFRDSIGEARASPGKKEEPEEEAERACTWLFARLPIGEMAEASSTAMGLRELAPTDESEMKKGVSRK